ncbi:alpha/beta hydrolase [Verticiella sediminum]|uniref:Alpha/beta hydrolase n=2 Tax=Verticiella sediminum TaxID=1247510 RepID=A0A556AZ10_9BURK|nr:alpha/beta hydrolase [Verticiella sediminum]
MPACPPLVLIHGAWQGSWAFDGWRPLLEAAGWQVHAVDLPGNDARAGSVAQANLEGYTEHVLHVLQRIGAPSVVLGHSGGGITASQVAQAAPERVHALVYVSGMMLPSGMSYAELIAECRRRDPAFHYEGVGPRLAWEPDGSASRVPADAARDLFLHDCEPNAAAAAAARLCPQPEPGRDMRNRLSAARFGRVPRLYIECLQDRSVTLPLQRLMQALTPGAVRVSLDCGHVPQLACPLDLLNALHTGLAMLAAPALDPDAGPC